MSPVICFARAVQRVRKFVRRRNKNTPLCTVSGTEIKTTRITQKYTLKLLRDVCRSGGGQDAFGFKPKQIGNKSIRTGAVMSLFLQGHSAERIMLLGRWKSTCFIDYLRPQTLEWTHLFSTNMIAFSDIFELLTLNEIKKTIPRKKDLEMPNFLSNFERTNGLLRNCF